MAQLTVRQFENDTASFSDGSVVTNDDHHVFENMFVDKGKHSARPGRSHHFRPPQHTQ